MNVVITGTGAVSGYGVGVPALLDGVATRQSAIRPVELLSAHPCDLAAAVPDDFDPADHLPGKLVRKMERSQHFGTIAVDEAIRSAHEDGNVDHRCGLLMGSAYGPMEAAEANYSVLRTERRARLSPFGFLRFQFSGLTAWPTIQHDLQGPGAAVAGFNASGIINVGLAARWIQEGRARQMVAGAADAIREELHVGLTAAGAISSEECDLPPLRAFDRSSVGTILGDGAAAFFLESESGARERGANVQARILGMGQAHSGAPPDRFSDDPTSLAIAIDACLREADISPEEIDLIVATGSGIPAEDQAETMAVFQALGKAAPEIPVLALKGYTGHTSGASGLIDAIIALDAARRGYLPPTPGLNAPISSLDHLVGGKDRACRPHSILVLAHGIGGQCAALVLQRP